MDESLTGFLPFYNQQVLSLRARLGFFPAPTFSFRAWLGGLIVAIILGFLMTFLVQRGGRGIRWVTTVLAVLMVGNALGHLVVSVYQGRALPGVWSSPLLLVAATWMAKEGFTGEWRKAGEAG